MKVGTKSLLYGAHQFILHPIIVTYCYIKLYGVPFNPLIWISIVIHDWGYWGLNNMDGDELGGGKWHPYWAFRQLFDSACYKAAFFCLFHSRYMLDKANYKITEGTKSVISRLGVADKLAIVYTPLFMYCKDELAEYLTVEGMENTKWDEPWSKNAQLQEWKKQVDEKCLKFVDENKDIAYDIQQY